MSSLIASTQRYIDTLRNKVRLTVREFAKFGIIGAINTVVDIGLWNVLYSIGEVKAKIIASIVATTCAFFMNRHWTFRHRSRNTLHREYLLFFFFNGIGLTIQAGSVALAKYGFDITDRLMLNVINILAIGLAMIFRFWSYRRWVWILDPTTQAANTTKTSSKNLPQETQEADDTLLVTDKLS